jgi:hypothetical protein
MVELALSYPAGLDEAETLPFWFGVSIGIPHFFKQLCTPRATLGGRLASNSAMFSPLSVLTPKSACTTSAGSSNKV